jgi:hypothetical protein
MKCENFLLLIDAYIEDDLESQDNSEVSEHLAVCESCAFSYQKIRREQEMFERYFLEAEATPALWKNLQSAIRNEKTAQPASSTTLLGRKFEKFFRDISFGFSSGKVAFAGLGILVLCTFIFLFIQRENTSVEYAETNSNILRVSQIDKQVESQSSVSGINQKEDVQISQTPSTAKTTAKQLIVKQFRQSSKQVKVLPRRNSDIASSRTESEKNLLSNEQKYLETIAKLTAEVKSVETNMPPVLSVEYKRNLLTVDQAIAETRSAAQRYPKNLDVANFVLSAYRGKIALLSDVAKKSKSSTANF